MVVALSFLLLPRRHSSGPPPTRRVDNKRVYAECTRVYADVRSRLTTHVHSPHVSETSSQRPDRVIRTAVLNPSRLSHAGDFFAFSFFRKPSNHAFLPPRWGECREFADFRRLTRRSLRDTPDNCMQHGPQQCPRAEETDELSLRSEIVSRV